MGLAWQLRAAWRYAGAALQSMRERGYGPLEAALLQLPVAAALRGWRRLARPLNGRGPLAALNARRFERFQQRLQPTPELRLVVIVMPWVLHFLLPCLALLRGRLPIVLVANGARRWELELLRRHLPEVPLFVLARLPGSSVEHGDVVSLLLDHHRGDFAIVDHDCYLLDPKLLAQLQPRTGECLVALFSDRHPHVDLDLPLTHALALNAQTLRAIARRHGVGARSYRHTPPQARAAFARLGLGPDGFLKPYQRYHDTLHVLLALALAEGLQVRVPDAAGAALHLGGTSIGSHHTKPLSALCLHLAFVELIGDDELARRYRRLTRPLSSAAEARARLLASGADLTGVELADTLLPRLRDALHQAWPDRYP